MSERSLVAASREGGRVELRSPCRAARVSGASSRRLGKVGGWSYARDASQGTASERSLIAASREGGRVELLSTRRAARCRAGRW